MAESSIFTNIVIRDRDMAERFIMALESSALGIEDDDMSDLVKELKDKAEIQNFMGKKGGEEDGN